MEITGQRLLIDTRFQLLFLIFFLITITAFSDMGLYTKNKVWTLAGPKGFLIPVRDKDGLIQGIKIRLDDFSL